MAAGLLPEPYREVAPDGREYFKILGASRHLLNMYRLLLTAADLAAVRPGGSGQQTATRISVLIAEIQRRMDGAAVATAHFADEAIRDEIDATRVRSSTLGVKDHHSHLRDGIVSRPVPSVLPGAGSVGLADISALNDATRRPSTNSHKDTYWEAQEFGSDHLVGKTLYGVFQDGESKPSIIDSGVHPVFEYRKKGNTPRFKMTIRNAIEAGAFLRGGGYEAYGYRRELHHQIESFSIDEMKTIAAGDLGGVARP